ncbi:hypothetical protein VN0759_05700 [Helicobacter pylori]|nr:hypothetical protein VN0759_05700 [Helicobacter pylori]
MIPNLIKAIAGYIQAFSSTQQQLQDLSFYGKWFFAINKYFENYFCILDYQTPKPETQVKLEEKIQSITFKNVSFSYPNSKLIFENFNLSLHSDKIYALVGKNASGKTTLIKLLLGFYAPNSGQIIINNKYSLQDLELNSYHQQISAIFQDFSLYAGYSINDNLFMRDDPTREQLKQKREMLKSFDENFQNCLNDYSNALFGTQYNGIDFSLGQKQREKIQSITFKNVSFSYPNSKLIFENFNLSLHSDKIYALVGKNASGKTTLIKLLLGFYAPNSGQIIINNKYSLQDLELNSYHQQISAIFQDFSLYAGYSINDNLFMRDDPTREQLKQKREMLKSFDENFQNCLNDYSNALFGTQYNGIDFSLGQKQRIATIRAFLKPSHCVVLDEPSSAIDPIIEKEFLDFIFRKSQSKMALIITHRMGSIKKADEIIVLDKGKLIEQGNFETLIKKQGLFSELYLKQQY